MAATASARSTVSKSVAAAREALADYDVHEAADMFPLISDDELRALAEDIAAHGQQEPVWLHQGQLLDGRNRVIACALIGRTPVTQEWRPRPGETPATFVMSRNIHRRHLSASQRAAIAVELQTVIAEENRRAKAEAKNKPAPAAFSHTPDTPVALAADTAAPVEFSNTAEPPTPAVRPGRSRDQAAKAMRVSAGYVNDAKDLKQADPQRFNQVKSGELTLARAQEQVVAEAEASGTLDTVKLRPGAVRSALARIEADRQPTKPKQQKPDPIRLPKASRVTTSATSLTITVTFGNPTVAEEWLNRMQDDKRVLDLDYTVLDKRPRKRKK